MNKPELIWLLTKVANNIISAEEAANKILEHQHETRSINENKDKKKFKNVCLYCGKKVNPGEIFCNNICNHKNCNSD